MTYELHPLCTLFPRMGENEYETLKNDIAANGLQQPIILHEGMILDGGNRYRACVDAGIKPTFKEYKGDSIVQFVLSANLHRRHLSAGQQAAIVASAQDWANAQPVGGTGANQHTNKEQTGNVAGLQTVADRAAQSGASERTQRMADKVAKADPELAKKVARGEVSLPKAAAKVDGKKQKKSKRELNAVPDEIKDYDPRDDELKAAHQAASELAAENDRLKDQIAVESMDASEEAKTQAAETIADLRTENKNLLAELAAVKVSRDTYQRENGELKKQCAAQQREIKKLRLAFEKRAA